ncbi:MAG: PEGA domain-containing protein [Deltaproteobacteria bacterium]|nr:PEGA domain-containing protein [Deltaproteobacteria bacterium]
MPEAGSPPAAPHPGGEQPASAEPQAHPTRPQPPPPPPSAATPEPVRPQPTNTFHSLDSDPPGATVSRSGRVLGVTPLMVGAPFQPGASYQYQLVLPGYQPALVTLPLNGGMMQQKIRLHRQ